MILTSIELKRSEIHGIGCFSKQAIAKGELIWDFNENFDLVLTEKDLSQLSEAARENVLIYAYKSKITGDFILCSDDSKFFNHSNSPNVTCVIPVGAIGNELKCFANKDIEVGQELTCDYREFDFDPYDIMESNG